jgi:hypothetical protein
MESIQYKFEIQIGYGCLLKKKVISLLNMTVVSGVWGMGDGENPLLL